MRSETPNRARLNGVDGQRAPVDAPSRTRTQVFVVVAQVPHQIGGAVVGDAEVVCDGGDPAQRVIVVGSGRVDLADGRMLGPGQTGEGGHRRANPVAAAVHAHRIERPWRVW
jgi:hypothetical protein